ncbi:putative lipase, alpha/beta hydrolase family [Nocardia nova SH22a]|uniref:Putative lipase, alpha/beta hydrolase family n=1 Tax=Nocardia nova SH22a TaxID=1415166 RepID=W5T8U6_9NOCA|nr:putative lipase, alpha/beta hydrolase family [Nocardia nova SH22a]
MAILLCTLLALAAPRAAALPVEVPSVAGANDFACRTTPDKPYPVVLAHGAATDAQTSFAVLAPELRKLGYCVFAADIGRAKLPNLAMAGVAKQVWPGWGPVATTVFGSEVPYGVTDIQSQTNELSAFVTMVRGVTGAPKVIMVGHSTGGTEIRELVRRHPEVIDRVVTVGTPYRGSTFQGLPSMYPVFGALGLDGPETAAQVYGPAGAEQVPGTPTLDQLNAGGETRPGINYTAIASHTDEVITPPETALLSDPRDGNRNIWVQDGCPDLAVAHAQLLSDPRAIADIVAAVTDGPLPPPC